MHVMSAELNSFRGKLFLANSDVQLYFRAYLMDFKNYILTDRAWAIETSDIELKCNEWLLYCGRLLCIINGFLVMVKI